MRRVRGRGFLGAHLLCAFDALSPGTPGRYKDAAGPLLCSRTGFYLFKFRLNLFSDLCGRD